MHWDPKRSSGNAVMVVVLLLLLVGGALGLNYVRNYEIDQEEQKTQRPYSRYQAADLAILAEGYRMELAKAEKSHGRGRVETRQRHHFDDQIAEFERVQRATRRVHDKVLDLAQLRGDLAEIEAEQQRRGAGGGDIAVHVTRMFRL